MMASIIQTRARSISMLLQDATSVPSRAFNWLISLDTKYREKCRMAELTNRERLDMGMPLRPDPPRFPDVGW